MCHGFSRRECMRSRPRPLSKASVYCFDQLIRQLSQNICLRRKNCLCEVQWQHFHHVQLDLLLCIIITLRSPDAKVVGIEQGLLEHVIILGLCALGQPVENQLHFPNIPLSPALWNTPDHFFCPFTAFFTSFSVCKFTFIPTTTKKIKDFGLDWSCFVENGPVLNKMRAGAMDFNSVFLAKGHLSVPVLP